MAIFPPLTIAREALLAHQRSLQVTGHNIANVDTPGFSRQRAVLRAVPPAGGDIGSGVHFVGLDRIVDRFIEHRRLGSASDFGAATTTRDLLARLEGYFPVNEGGIGAALQEFFAAANTLATNPESQAVRSDLLAAGAALALDVRTAADAIHTLQREIDQRLGQEVQDANAVLLRIASLNREIVAADVAGASTSDLRDARQEALRELAGSAEINVVEQGDGSVSVFAGVGTALVLGTTPAVLEVRSDGGLGLDGAPLSRVGLASGGGGFVPLAGALGGRLGGLVALRDETLVQNSADLDLFATSLRDAVNAVQTDPAGRDLDGLVGAAFFAGSGAGDLTVALADPRGLAAAQSANPGDNTNALALVAVQDLTLPALGGRTLEDHFGAFHASIGAQARSANDQALIRQEVDALLEEQRDAVSGVSLEEEFTDLIRVQRAFQAAAQLISVANTMLDDLLGVVR